MHELDVYQKLIFALISIIVTLLTLAGYAGNYHRYLEFAANFKHQYLLLSSCLFFFGLLTRRYLWLLLILIVILLNAIAIVPWYFKASQPVADTKYESVRILAFNVLHQNKRYEEAINLVKNRRVDIATFLEATPPWDTELLALKEILPYHFSAKKLQIEIYSKYPLQNPEIILYGTYRGLVASEISWKKSRFVFVATHAYPQLYYGNEGWQIRNEQLLEGIGNKFKKSVSPTIIAGDLNVTMWSPQYKSMMKKSGLKNARRGFGILPTQSNYYPKIPCLAIPLDHFLLSQNIIVTNMETEKNIGSDHLPILLDVLIPNL